MLGNPFNGVLGCAELTANALKGLNVQCTAQQTQKDEGNEHQKDADAIDGGITVKSSSKVRDNVTKTDIMQTLRDVNGWCNNIIENSRHIRDILDNVLDLR
jgi:hypothetical protein